MNKAEKTSLIDNRLINVLAMFAKVPNERVGEHTFLKDDLGIDSVDALDLMFILEKEFEIGMLDKDMVNIRTVGNLNSIISKKILTQRVNGKDKKNS